MTVRAVAGLDIGSTSIKTLVTTLEGEELLVEHNLSPWTTFAQGHTHMSADDVLGSVLDLFERASSRLQERFGDYQITGIGVSGMAEAGVLLDETGSATAPIIAWFDPRGEDEILTTPKAFQDEFLGTTGLPVGPLVTIAKLLHSKSIGVELVGHRWLNLLEFVVHKLGGRIVTEYSLASRTGLLDQDSARPWQQALDLLGVTEDFLPELASAGDVVGTADNPSLPRGFHGARLTVAGHDHLVSAVAAGATTSDQIYDSMGTAEAMVRILDDQLPFDARERLDRAGINALRHVIPNKYVLLAGTKSGLIMRMVFQLLGISDANGRDAIDEAAMRLPIDGEAAPGSIEVTGARNGDGVLQVRVNGDGVSPAEILTASLLHGDEMCAELTDRGDEPRGSAGNVHTTDRRMSSNAERQTCASAGSARRRVLQSERRHRLRSCPLRCLRGQPRRGRLRPGIYQFCSQLLQSGRIDFDPGEESEVTGNEKKALSLSDIATEDNTFAMVAMDQRNTFKRMYRAVGIESLDDEDLVDIKADVVNGLKGSANAFLLGPTYGIPAREQVAGQRPGILVAAEQQERGNYDGEPRGSRIPEQGRAWVCGLSGDALKFLIQIRPFRPHPAGTPDLVEEALAVITEVVEDARTAGVPSVIENLTYTLSGERLAERERADQIIEAGRLLDGLKPDLLKLEYPGSPEACRRFAKAISALWTVPSPGVGFDEFTEVLKISCDEGGASGFIAGRALWKEAVGMDPQARRTYLANVAARRLDECVEAISGGARPWNERA